MKTLTNSSDQKQTNIYLLDHISFYIIEPLKRPAYQCMFRTHVFVGEQLTRSSMQEWTYKAILLHSGVRGVHFKVSGVPDCGG